MEGCWAPSWLVIYLGPPIFFTEVYAPWEGGVGDTEGANRCVLMEARSQYKWNDVVCGTPAAYICQKGKC